MSNRSLRVLPSGRRMLRRTFVLLALAYGAVAPQSWAAADPHPLRTADTSSPRSTLASLLAELDEGHAELLDERPQDAAAPMLRARHCLDLSDVPARRKHDIAVEAVRCSMRSSTASSCRP